MKTHDQKFSFIDVPKEPDLMLEIRLAKASVSQSKSKFQEEKIY